jgi:hypothetical protein
LTILRNPNPSDTLYASNADFQIALDIFDTSISHSIFLASVKSQEFCPVHLEPVFRLFNQNEGSLTRSEINSMSEQINIPKSTLTQHLKQLVQLGFISKVGHGIYKTPSSISSISSFDNNEKKKI